MWSAFHKYYVACCGLAWLSLGMPPHTEHVTGLTGCHNSVPLPALNNYLSQLTIHMDLTPARKESSKISQQPSWVC